MFHVSCLGIWWRHDIWISKMLKVNYLKNEKSFQSEIKSIFPVSIVPSFRHTKKTSKNVVDTTFKPTKSVQQCGLFISSHLVYLVLILMTSQGQKSRTNMKSTRMKELYQKAMEWWSSTLMTKTLLLDKWILIIWSPKYTYTQYNETIRLIFKKSIYHSPQYIFIIIETETAKWFY